MHGSTCFWVVSSPHGCISIQNLRGRQSGCIVHSVWLEYSQGDTNQMQFSKLAALKLRCCSITSALQWRRQLWLATTLKIPVSESKRWCKTWHNYNLSLPVSPRLSPQFHDHHSGAMNYYSVVICVANVWSYTAAYFVIPGDVAWLLRD